MLCTGILATKLTHFTRKIEFPSIIQNI